MQPCPKLGARAANPVFSLTAVALFTFLGLSAATARAGVIAAQFGNNESFEVPFLLQNSVEPDAALVDPVFSNSTIWNALLTGTTHSGSISFPNLQDVSGAGTGTTLSISNIDGSTNTLERGAHAGELPDTFLFSNSSTQFTFSGLFPNAPFTLFIYAHDPVFPRQQAVFMVGLSTFDTENGTPTSLDPDCCVSGVLTGTTDATGAIHGTWTIGAQNELTEIGWSGFQLEVVPEPYETGLVGIALGLILVGVRRKAKTPVGRES